MLLDIIIRRKKMRNSLVESNNTVTVEDEEIIMNVIKSSGLTNYAQIVGEEIVKGINELMEELEEGVVGDKDFKVKYIETSMKIKSSKIGINVFHKLFDEEVDDLYEKTDRLSKIIENLFKEELYANL
jgi:hypothetical protein